MEQGLLDGESDRMDGRRARWQVSVPALVVITNVVVID